MTIEATLDSYDEIPDHAFRNSMIYIKIYSGKIEGLYRYRWIKNKWPNERKSIHGSL